MTLALIAFICVQAFFGGAFYGAAAILYYGLTALLRGRFAIAELTFIFFVLIFVIAIPLVRDVPTKWVVFDLFRYSTPFILFFLGRQSSYKLDSEAFSRAIFVSLWLYIVIGFIEFAYASFFGLSLEDMRKLTMAAPFDVLCFLAILLTGGNLTASRSQWSSWLALATAFIVLQQSRTATFALLFILLVVMFGASVRARVAGALAFSLGLLYFTANPEFISDMLTRGLGELVYTPSSDGVSNADIYKNWRGYEIAAVFTQSVNSSAWSIAFGHGLGAAINLPAPMQITDEMFSDHVYKIHSLFAELFFKFGVVGYVVIIALLKTSIVDNEYVGPWRTRLTLLVVLLLSSVGTHGLLVAPIVFFFLGYASRRNAKQAESGSQSRVYTV
jgi:hypothetical protein